MPSSSEGARRESEGNERRGRSRHASSVPCRMPPGGVLRCAVIVALAVIPPLLLCGYVSELGVDVPYQDQWAAMIPLLQRSAEGELTLGDFWHRHNEHRLPLPKMLLLLLAERTRWNVRAELVASISISFAGFGLLAWTRAMHARRAGRPLIDWTFPAASLVFFSAGQWENWLWGWQVAVHMCLFFLIGLIAIFAARRLRGLTVLAGVVLAVCASCSYGAGIVAWLVGALAILGCARSSRALGTLALCMIWSAATMLFLILYFSGDGVATQGPETTESWNALRYFLRFISSPICYRWPRWSEFAGIALLAVFAGAVWETNRKRGGPRPWCTVGPLLGLSSIGIAAITTAGRHGYGLEQAFESRYLAFSSLLLIAIVYLAADASQSATERDARRLSPYARIGTGLIVSVMLILFALCAKERLRDGMKHSMRLHRARQELISPRPDYSRIALYPGEQSLRIMAGMLRRWGISVYRPAAPASGSGASLGGSRARVTRRTTDFC